MRVQQLYTSTLLMIIFCIRTTMEALWNVTSQREAKTSATRLDGAKGVSAMCTWC